MRVEIQNNNQRLTDTGPPIEEAVFDAETGKWTLEIETLEHLEALVQRVRLYDHETHALICWYQDQMPTVYLDWRE